MSEGFKYQASPKDEDILVNVRGDSAEEFAFNLENFPHGSYAQFKANFRGGAALANVVQPQASPPPAQQGNWSQQSQSPAPTWATGQQQQAAPAQPQQQGQYGGPPHPEGKQCNCGKVLESKKTSSGKATWRCPDWRWNSGNPNGHDSEWAN